MRNLLLICSALCVFTVAAVLTTPTEAEAAPKNAVTVPYDGGLGGGLLPLSPKSSYILQCKDACVMKTYATGEDAGIGLTVDFRPLVSPESFFFDAAGATSVKVIGVDAGNPNAVLYFNTRNL